uniref:Uncharacterized protein n=1 Tax=Ditylum brightwellii TaxID=49249 RepID=A0A7S1VZ36_9STRA
MSQDKAMLVVVAYQLEDLLLPDTLDPPYNDYFSRNDMTNWCESLPSPPSRQPPTSLSPSLSTMTSLSHQPSSSPSIMTSSYTKMTYLLKVEYDSSKVLPTDFLTDSKYITRQITERMLKQDDLLGIYVRHFNLHFF